MNQVLYIYYKYRESYALNSLIKLDPSSICNELNMEFISMSFRSIEIIVVFYYFFFHSLHVILDVFILIFQLQKKNYHLRCYNVNYKELQIDQDGNYLKDF